MGPIRSILSVPFRAAWHIQRPWRVFHEFDRYSDARCRWVLKSRDWPFLEAGLIECAWVAALLMVLAVVAPIAWLAISVLLPDRVALGIALAAAFLLLLALTTVGVLAARAESLRQTLRLYVNRTLVVECGNCGYPLNSLTEHNGMVTCPECGTTAFRAKDPDLVPS